MNIDRRLALPALSLGVFGAFGLLAAAPVLAMTADEVQVSQNLEAHRVALMTGDAASLGALSAAELSYSHSDGHIEDKETFIANATNGKAKWLSLAYENPTVRIVGDTAIARFNFVGENVTGEKTAAVKLGVLTIWQKQDGQWKMLARSSTKL
jgi:hypothetical protein